MSAKYILRINSIGFNLNGSPDMTVGIAWSRTSDTLEFGITVVGVRLSEHAHETNHNILTVTLPVLNQALIDNFNEPGDVNINQLVLVGGFTNT